MRHRINEYKDLFASQFEVISAGSISEPNPDELLSQESPNNFLFFASVGLEAIILLMHRRVANIVVACWSISC